MARAVADPSGDPGGRERFIAAGLRVLHERGAAELTLRRVAELAGSSTMGIYSCFGGRAGMLEAMYRRGFELLEDAITAPRPVRQTRSGPTRTGRSSRSPPPTGGSRSAIPLCTR